MTTLMRRADGGAIGLDVQRWFADVDQVEAALLACLPDPVLDIGCGPGRVVVALAHAGRPALGIDPDPDAVLAARRRGAAVLARSVFDPFPGEGRWASALLLDGNVGIDGDPERLLRRVHDVLAPDGVVVAEVLPPGAASERFTVRLEAVGHESGPWFPWASLGADDFASLAAAASLVPAGVREAGGRWFAQARRP